MKTRKDAERKAAELNGEVPIRLATGGQLFYGIDQSHQTGAWRVIEHRDGYPEKVVAS